MTKEKFFIGAPAVFEGKIFIYPPLLKDIISNDNFFMYAGLLIQNQEDIEDLYGNEKIEKLPTPLEFLLAQAFNDDNIKKMIEDAFFFFTHEKANFLYEQKCIILGNLEKEIEYIKDVKELKILNEENFNSFQNMIRISMGENIYNPPDPNESKLLKDIRRKNRHRERLSKKNQKGISLNTSLTAICCMGLGINPLNIGELSYASFRQLISMYQQKESFDIDIRSLLAGADSKKVKPKYWISEKSDYIEVQI